MAGVTTAQPTDAAEPAEPAASRSPAYLISETATGLHHALGVVHVDGDYTRIAEVRPLIARRLG